MNAAKTSATQRKNLRAQQWITSSMYWWVLWKIFSEYKLDFEDIQYRLGDDKELKRRAAYFEDAAYGTVDIVSLHPQEKKIGDEKK